MIRRWLLLLCVLSWSAPAVADDEGLTGKPIVRPDKHYSGVLHDDGALSLVNGERRSVLRLGEDRLSDQLRSLAGWWVEIAAREHEGKLYTTELLSPRPEFEFGWVSRGAAGFHFQDRSSPDQSGSLTDPGGVLDYALDAETPRDVRLYVLRLRRQPEAVDELRLVALEARVTSPTQLFENAASVFGLLWAPKTGRLGDPLTHKARVTSVQVEDAAKAQVAAFVRREAEVYAQARDPYDGQQRYRWSETITSGFLDASVLEFGHEVATLEGELRVSPSTLYGEYHGSDGSYMLTFPDDVSLDSAGGLLGVFAAADGAEPMEQLRKANGRRVRITAVRTHNALTLSALSVVEFLDKAGEPEPREGLADRVR